MFLVTGSPGDAVLIEGPNAGRNDFKDGARQPDTWTKARSHIERIDFLHRHLIIDIAKAYQHRKARQSDFALSRQLLQLD